jgi:hypothetical protein
MGFGQEPVEQRRATFSEISLYGNEGIARKSRKLRRDDGLDLTGRFPDNVSDK